MRNKYFINAFLLPKKFPDAAGHPEKRNKFFSFSIVLHLKRFKRKRIVL